MDILVSLLEFAIDREADLNLIATCAINTTHLPRYSFAICVAGEVTAASIVIDYWKVPLSKGVWITIVSRIYQSSLRRHPSSQLKKRIFIDFCIDIYYQLLWSQVLWRGTLMSLMRFEGLTIKLDRLFKFGFLASLVRICFRCVRNARQLQVIFQLMAVFPPG